MNNRLPKQLPVPKRQGRPSQPTFDALRNQAAEQISDRIAVVGDFIKQHPAKGIASAFCIGILLGWLIKRR